MIRICALWVLGLAVLGCQPRRPASPPPLRAPTAAPHAGPVEGTVALDGGGLHAAFRYDFDHDDLRHVVAAEPGPIAVTRSGNLLGFTADLAVDREVVVSPPVTVLTAIDDGRIIAGLSDGTLAAVEPRTLALTRIAGVVGTPLWIQRHRHQLIVVVAIGLRRVVHRLAADDPSRAELPLAVPRRDGPGVASVWMIDRAGRLWYGADQGEWGGWLGSIDLALTIKGPLPAPPIPTDDGVAGFIEVGGAVWAYGGTTHMGHASSSIHEVRGGAVHRLWSAESPRLARGAAPPATARERGLPITRMLELDGRLHAILWNELYEVDAKLTTWKRVAAVPARIRWGRPDAVGAYPAIRGVLARPGGELVLATTRDGLFRIRGDTVEAHPIDDPLDSDLRVGASPLGLVGQAGHTLYRRVAGRWERAPWPARFEHVFELALVTAPDRAPHLLVDADHISPSPLFTLRWDAPGFVELGSQDGPSARGALFLGDDLWIIEAGDLWRWHAPSSTWRRFARPGSGARGHVDVGPTLTGLAPTATGWLIHDPFVHGLHHLSLDRAGTPTLARFLARLRIDDAIPWDRGLVLLATPSGLRTLSPTTHQVQPAALPAPPSPAELLARDRDGRLWLATSSALFVLDGAALRPVPVPALAHRPIDDLVADPAGGIAISLGAAGIVHVSLGPAAPGSAQR